MNEKPSRPSKGRQYRKRAAALGKTIKRVRRADRAAMEKTKNPQRYGRERGLAERQAGVAVEEMMQEGRLKLAASFGVGKENENCTICLPQCLRQICHLTLSPHPEHQRGDGRQRAQSPPS